MSHLNWQIVGLTAVTALLLLLASQVRPWNHPTLQHKPGIPDVAFIQ